MTTLKRTVRRGMAGVRVGLATSWPAFDVRLVIPKRAQRLPELLTRDEVRRILCACANLVHAALHLRHAYATHQLENGLPVHQLQRLLGHGNLQSTMRCTHWVPERARGERGCADLIAALEVRHG